MLKNLKLRAKILLILLFSSIVSAGIVGVVSLTLGTKTLKEESFNKLTAIREMKANQIENYFQEIFNQLLSLSESRTVVEATIDFRKGFDNLQSELDYSHEDLNRIDSVLFDYYQTQFIEQLLNRDSSINYFSIPIIDMLKGQESWLNVTFLDSSVNTSMPEFPRLHPVTFRIGTDAIIVVVSENNDFISNLSMDELRKVFSSAIKWSDIHPEWPDQEIERFIPDVGSGSFNRFSEIVLGGESQKLSALPNATIIKDGTVMKKEMLNDPYTIAFFSYNYFDRNANQRIVHLDGRALNNTTIRNNQYPLTRPLYLVTTEEKLRTNQAIPLFINFFLN
ncbi:MAG: hypothetical protein DRJ13_05285 [Bacteroidetes bacterium]|nr:MAG: hypothetical protein DRJ13_05285 [Bacteroidota bacterium]